MTEFERKNCVGDWEDENNIDNIIEKILLREPIIAPRFKRKPMESRQDVLDFLATGQEINYDDYWYATIRLKQERPLIDWAEAEKRHENFEKTDYLATHDNDWYEN